MTLSELLKKALGETPDNLPNVEVRGVAQDNRRVEPGFVFVARRGEVVDGHRFVEGALARGAVAVVGEASDEERSGFSWHGRAPYLQVENDKVALAKLAATFYDHPSKSLFTIGVTGTDGKTTTSYLLHHLLSGSQPTGLLSTAGVKVRDEALGLEGHFTTPEAPEVQGFLARFRDACLTHAVVESSSHGFSQHRLDGVDYDVGVLTNLSPEHLDHHKTFEAYREAKGTLMKRARVSVLNADDPAFDYFAGVSNDVVSYGVETHADWRATDVEEAPGLLRWTLRIGDEDYPAALPMVGAYNVHNALAALAAAHEAGLEPSALLQRLRTFPGVPGRMQLVQAQPFSVVVDFAHTAPALNKALGAVRSQIQGKLIVVIGAAGERDPGKRSPLGEAAVRGADVAIFTEEDSRSEDVHTILAAMVKGAERAGGREGETFWAIPDRLEAIHKAVTLAKPGDGVVLCGKGHERTLERANETLQWDEAEEARRALEAQKDQQV